MDRTYLEISNFTPGIYKIEPDLRHLGQDELEAHYLRHGIEEGRFYNTITDDKAFLDFINKRGKILELDPQDSPRLDSRSTSYYSADVFFRRTSFPTGRPPYIITDNDYSIIPEKFNCILSSHHIQHAPCVVRYLDNLGKLLTDDGSINIIIPDKRYCFDHFKNETSVYDVIQLYHENLQRPRLSDVLRMTAQSTHNNSEAHWQGGNHGIDRTEADLPGQYEKVLKEYNSGKYIDAHVSHFTPMSFLTTVNVLKDLGLINIRVHKMFHTLRGAIEFYVILKKNK